jgi:hypothetical protein
VTCHLKGSDVGALGPVRDGPERAALLRKVAPIERKHLVIDSRYTEACLEQLTALLFYRLRPTARRSPSTRTPAVPSFRMRVAGTSGPAGQKPKEIVAGQHTHGNSVLDHGYVMQIPLHHAVYDGR